MSILKAIYGAVAIYQSNINLMFETLAFHLESSFILVLAVQAYFYLKPTTDKSVS